MANTTETPTLNHLWVVTFDLTPAAQQANLEGTQQFDQLPAMVVLATSEKKAKQLARDEVAEQFDADLSGYTCRVRVGELVTHPQTLAAHYGY